MASSWFTFALGAVGFLLSADGALARLSSSPTYRNANTCPERCLISGPNTGNWSVYPDFKDIQRCQEAMFYDFSLHDQVDDPAGPHRIQACSSFGPDFSMLPDEPSAGLASTKSIQVQLEIGWWEEGFGMAASGIRSLVSQLRKYIDHGHGASADQPLTIFGQFGQATIGLYIGQGLLRQSLSTSALKRFQDNLDNLNVSTPTLAMQLCKPGYDKTHIFGIMATSNGTFTSIQNAIKTWANASCLSFSESSTITEQAVFTTPLIHANQTSNSTVLRRRPSLQARAECRSIQVEQNDFCDKLASKCGISSSDFIRYNSGSSGSNSFCTKLQPKQHVCCSSGDLPDFSPQPGADGSCHAYQVQGNDNCANLASEYSLTIEKLEEFNKKTWGWNGCKLLFKDTVMCLSEGNPPFPAPIANAVCGPQKPGSKKPTDNSDISKLNPCPLNACCNIWGQCGITQDFCVDTNTGAPGTAEPGTYGCISNCGTDVIKGDGSGGINIGYFEGYNMNRKCLYQHPMQIDTSKYTHIHFGFGTLTPSFEVEVGDALSTYHFGEFTKIEGAKRILSFGGWEFSTSPATYAIFRDAVTPANRLKTATNIANFIKKHDLDGVDIDWEYPGAPDLPIIPAGGKEEGPNYLAFLVILKNLLRGKSVSIAAPSSYWYLKQFPIKEIGRIVDYIVYMTYDLHGQWDYDNAYSQEGCGTGRCLRSQVNLTETKQALAMITKAGVPGKKVVVGITSYGRSFNMAQAGCWGPQCQFTGSGGNSDATKGKCTDTAGYLADAEIAEIMRDSSRVVTSFVDPSSNTDVLVYDTNQWVGWMSEKTKRTRTNLYKAWGMGGTTDWATDLQEYHDVPGPAKSWAIFKELASTGNDPLQDKTRDQSWVQFDCTLDIVKYPMGYTPSQRWERLHADAAWKDVLRIWRDTDRPKKMTFINSVAATLHSAPAESGCEYVKLDSCKVSKCSSGMNGEESGPAGEIIWNSLVRVHLSFTDYRKAIFEALGLISISIDELMNRFAPISASDGNMWNFLLIDLITVGTLSVAGPFFNSYLKSLPYFASGARLDNVKDSVMNLIGQSTTLAKDLLPAKEKQWKTDTQISFKEALGKVIGGWADIIEEHLLRVFDGSDSSIELLGSAIAGGKLIAGKREDGSTAPKPLTAGELRKTVERTFYGYAVPELWRSSGRHPFIIDAGFDCGKGSLPEYVSDEEATRGCVDGKQYYLVHPSGDAQSCPCKGKANCYPDICTDRKFSSLPGVSTLGTDSFGGLSRSQLIEGAVRTWLQNGRSYGGGFIDITKQGSREDLLDTKVTTPGFVRMPVCSPAVAWRQWDKGNSSEPDYPCHITPGVDTCGDSTFEDQTNNNSPLVEDCLAMIRKYEVDFKKSWNIQVLGKNQREIGDAGGCHFGAEATEQKGNAHFTVGAQDLIDITNEAIKRFGSGGRVAAKGNMKCNGNIKGQAVKWGIYNK
ncbi:chitinase [Apiospora kogelbergensis]|uniref:chitinase n=1 Tax=Apiospora kogelbergensis TaxID=1337665 RepID=A0AAW0R5N4_9PEZI